MFDTFGTFRNVLKGINSTLTVCPPSGAIAGIYALVDNQRGVWKAPANVSLNGVIAPNDSFATSETDALNVDAVAGKSINAIRAFVGKGTLVWGARTLAGNDNEWRYVSVRRFFNMVEESIKKSTYWAVFEPNDANTWVKVRGMIENYLTQKWREGALAGATTKDAFFVRCGLGVTMSAQDILEGRMIVEIGVALDVGLSDTPGQDERKLAIPGFLVVRHMRQQLFGLATGQVALDLGEAGPHDGARRLRGLGKRDPETRQALLADAQAVVLAAHGVVHRHAGQGGAAVLDVAARLLQERAEPDLGLLMVAARMCRLGKEQLQVEVERARPSVPWLPLGPGRREQLEPELGVLGSRCVSRR